MEQRPTSGYIFIGTAVRFLQDTMAGAPVFGDGRLQDNTQRFMNKLTQYEFHVTRRACLGFTELLTEWEADRLAHEGDEDWLKTRSLFERRARAAHSNR